MDYKVIGENIKNARRKNNLTQLQLAERINKSESSIRKYEKGLVEIPHSVIKKIADELNMNEMELIGIEMALDIISDGMITEMKNNIIETFDNVNTLGKQLINDYCDMIKSYPQLYPSSNKEI